MNLFDRYLLKRFWHAYALTFCAMLGLFIVFNAFANIDEFGKSADDKAPKPPLAIMLSMGRYYLLQSTVFFNTLGSVVALISTMLVLAVVQRNGELNPILSAGIPTYRLAQPIIWGMLSINGILILNQEFVIPRFASEIQLRPGDTDSSTDRIRPTHDFSSHIGFLSGNLYPRKRRLSKAEVVLPEEIVYESRGTSITAAEAIYKPRDKTNPRAGWLLRGTDPKFSQLRLTPFGNEVVLPKKAPDEIFIVTDINFDHLMQANTSHEFLSTWDLVKQVKNPAYGLSSVRAQTVHLHSRVTRLVMNVLVALLIVPLIVRKESRSLILGLTASVAAIVLALGAELACRQLATTYLITPDLAAWAPVILFGTCSAWCSGLIRT